MKVTDEKECYCATCDKWFHYLGIASHRAMHRRKSEAFKIVMTDGTISERGEAKDVY